MSDSVIAARKPCLVQLRADRPVFWCSCGRSAKQPFCDGSHQGTGFEPVKYVPEADGEVLLCACKYTKTTPICDGSHNNLGDGGDYAVPPDDAGPDVTTSLWQEILPGFSRAALDNGCYIVRCGQDAYKDHGALALASAIGVKTGARYLSHYTGRLAPGVSDVLAFTGSDLAIFVVDGTVEIEIGGHHFSAGAESGIAVRPDEAFRLTNPGDTPVRLEFTVCPECPQIQVLETMPDRFDENHPDRMTGVDPGKREVMADRFYQVLVDSKVAGSAVTQFIGEIPCSRAKHHRHLYEEAILVLRGEGFMWTDTHKAPVAPGDIIFLPKKQTHSLECISEGGMRLMGVFYPSGSPAVNY